MSAFQPHIRFDMPRDVTQQLEIIRPMIGKAAISRASMALWSWSRITGPGLGLRAPRNSYRDCAHAQASKALPAFEICHDLPNGGTLKSLHFTDYSCVVLHDPGLDADCVTALPAVFQTLGEPLDPQLFMRANNARGSRKACRIELPRQGAEPYLRKRDTFTEAEIADSDTLRDHPALTAARRDLARLASLFDRAHWIAPPKNGPFETAPMTEAQAEGHGFGPDAVGQIAFWPTFLPHDWTTDEDRKAVRRHLDDLVAWIAHSYQNDLERVSYSTYLGTHDRKFSLMFHALNKRTAISTGFSIDFVATNPDACRLPVPDHRRFGLEWKTDKTQHGIRRVLLARGEARPLSNHEAVEMRARFGPLRADAFTDKEIAA